MSHNYNKYPPAGIDLGTSNSVLAVFEKRVSYTGARPVNISDNSPAGPLLPSAVLLEDDSLLVGTIAVNNRMTQPDLFTSAFKRKIGEDKANIKLGNKKFSPVDLGKEVIKKLLQEAISQELDFKPQGIVVAAPYNFNHIQKKNTEKVLEQAIAEIFSKYEPKNRPLLLGLIPEPVAAAINFAFNNKNNRFNDHNILIYDFGGGTLDITICKINVTPHKLNFEVLATDGCERFGGDDVDELLEGWLYDNFTEELKSDGLKDKLKLRLKQQVKNIVKSVKENLSSNEKSTFVEVLMNSNTLEGEITRKEFERILRGDNKKNRDFGNEFRTILDRIFNKARIAPDSIQTVLMVGGSSQIPYFKNLLKLKCSNANFITNKETIETGVAQGAAIYAAYLLDEKHNNHHNPFDEKLAFGSLVFRTPNTLGVKREGDLFEPIIPANSVVPASATKTFYFRGYKNNNKDLVATKIINVYQGESKLISKNTKVGEIDLPPVYVHNRELKDIPVNIRFNADENFVNIEILIPESDIMGNDIKIEEKLKL